MPELEVDATKFAGMSEEQARSFPRRTVVGEHLTDDQVAAMPKMISTDSHVMEPDEVWQQLSPRLRANMPKDMFRNVPPGAGNPHLRLRDQDADGVAAEVLFPNYGMALFALDDVETQQESFKLYNDWVSDFCSVDPKRLYGVPLVSTYDIKAGIKEMHRGHDLGLKGAMVWQVPHPSLPFGSPHYEPLWAACAEAGQPVICHILTGHSYAKTGFKGGVAGLKDSTNIKTFDTASTLFDIIFSGAFDRFPKLRLVIGHLGECLPLHLYRFDWMQNNADGAPGLRGQAEPVVLKETVSSYFRNNIWVTTSGVGYEPAIRFCMEQLGPERVLYAMDYPYQQSSDEVAAYDRMDFSPEHKLMLMQGNAERVFNLPR